MDTSVEITVVDQQVVVGVVTTSAPVVVSVSPPESPVEVTVSQVGQKGDMGTTDHLLLSNIGTNTHDQIDTHIADATIHHTQAQIRAMISESAIGLEYNSATGVLTLSAGYSIPTDVKQSEWDTAYSWGDHAGLYALGVHTHAASDITSGTFDNARISQSSVTQHQAAIDHDTLTNFVANEHIDWTSASQNLLTTGQGEFHSFVVIRDDGTKARVRLWNYSDNFYTDIYPSVATANRNIQFPDASGEVVLTSNAQTLTNKTLTLGSNTISGTKAEFDTAVTDGDFLFVGDAPTSHALLSHTISGETLGHVLVADSATTYSIRQLLGSEISNDVGWTTNTGTVTAIGVTTANGVSGSSSGGATPNLTITLGAITPTSVNSVVLSGSATPTLAVTGTSSISGSNTGDNAVNSLYSGLVSNATHTGDATGATALTVVALNGTNLAALATGILKNTTATGVPSIAVQADITALLGAGSITNTMLANAAVANLSGTNSGDQTITLTGDVTGSGTGSFATTIAAGAVDIAMLSATGTPSATTYLQGDGVWGTPAGGITNVVEDTTPQLGGDLDANGYDLLFDTGDGIRDSNGNEELLFTTIASAVNYINISNSATGNSPILESKGDDASVDFHIKAQGNGSVIIDTTLELLTNGSQGLYRYGTAAGSLTLKGADPGLGGAEINLYGNSNAAAGEISIVTTGGIWTSTATGGAQGIGTINAKGFYIDGVAVSTGGTTMNGITANGLLTYASSGIADVESTIVYTPQNLTISDTDENISFRISSNSAYVWTQQELTATATSSPLFIRSSILTANDADVNPLIVLRAERSSGALITRPSLAGYNYTTKQWEVAANGTWDFQTNKLTNVGDPTSAQDVVTKAYGDANYLGGGVAYGSDTQIPVMDSGGFVYSSSFIYDAGNTRINVHSVTLGKNGNNALITAATQGASTYYFEIRNTIDPTDDSGVVPITQLVSRDDTGAVSYRPTLAGYNYTTKQWEVAANGTWDFQTNKLTNVGDPTSAQDVVTKAYGDANYLGGGASQLSDLSDVVSATNTNRFALVANGTTGYVGRALVEADISDLATYALASHTHTQILELPTIFGSGGAIVADATNGVPTAIFVVPYACTIVGYDILADVSTTCTVDIWKHASAIPTNTDTIVASAPMSLTAGLKSVSTTLTGWTTALSAGDIIMLACDSNDNATHIHCKLHVTV